MLPPRRTQGPSIVRALLFLLAEVLVFSGALGGSERAAAQACHPGSFVAPGAPHDAGRALAVELGVRASAATYATRRYAGEYQALTPSAALVTRYVSADVALPVYRIVRNGLRDVGVGDLALAARVPVLHAGARATSAGLVLQGTLPTGASEKQLGMGHVMLMPGVYLALDTPALSLVAQLAYGRALGGVGDHAMHMGARPLVNPMNRAELAHAFSAHVRVVEGLRALARLYGALPAWDDDGEAREIVALGAEVTAGPADVRLEVELPLVGTPFEQRLVLAAAARF